ncbi:MAG: sigma-70 family RNA polymerase sigma factor [Pirellulales bacterium]|nr:sigma-70 family RNA polymerase sigma factor [Pirellulales bacterium]
MNQQAPAEWLADVLAEHEAPLVRYATRLTGNADRARDLVQEAFARLCAEDPSRLNGHVRAWLYRTVRHRVIDEHRKEHRMQSLEQAEGVCCTSREASPEGVLELRESAERVTELLAALPAREQEIVRLKFQEDLSYREIGEVLGLSVSNVGFLLHTAIKKLRVRMLATE